MSSKRWLILLALMATGLVAQRMCAPAPTAGPPQELLGRWTTASPAYADRYLEIRPTMIAFGQGEAGSEAHPITGVLGRSEPKARTTYQISYRLDASGAEGRIELSFDGSGGAGSEALEIASQPGIRWTLRR